MNAKQIISTLDKLKPLRQKVENIWAECFEYSYPIRAGNIAKDGDISPEEGQDTLAKNLDSTAADSLRIWASSIVSGTTPANSRWFSLDIFNGTDDEKKFLDKAADLIFKNIHASNFDASIFEAFIDMGCCGMFPLYVDENKTHGGFNFQLWPVGNVFVDSTRQDFIVDTIFYEYKLNATQIVREFGKENLNQEILDKAEKDDKTEFVLIHAIMPREKASGKMAKSLPFASYHVLVKEKLIVRESGYHEFPVAVPRHMRVPNSVYSTGPMYEALPDVKELNALKRMELEAAEIAIAGMWAVGDDAVLNTENIKIEPRAVISIDNVDNIKPLQSGSDFNVAFTKADELKASIRKILLADQLQPQDGPAMTATEVHVRVNLIRQLLGPVFGRLQSEYLQVVVERCFGIASRAGVLPVPPDSLDGKEFRVRYISPLARAQQLEDATAIERATMYIAQAAQVDPTILDNWNADEAGRRVAEAYGVPAEVLRDKEEVAQLRAQREEQAQQQQQQMQNMQMAEMAVQQ